MTILIKTHIYALLGSFVIIIYMYTHICIFNFIVCLLVLEMRRRQIAQKLNNTFQLNL